MARKNWIFGSVALVALSAVSIASGEDVRSWKLVRRTATVGDSFHAELSTNIRHGTAGKPLADGVKTTSAYTCSLLAKNATTGRFEAKLDLEPETTTVEEHGESKQNTKGARTVTLEMGEDELQVIPTPGGSGDMTAGKTDLSLGETWTTEKKVPVAGVVEVPVQATYRVASVEKDANGHELVKVTFSCSGVGLLASTGTKVTIQGAGHALLDPTKVERPVEVKLAYRFVAGSDQDPEPSESRSEITIRTHDVVKANEVNK
jgi:hypothetical protein